jgi:hypothetical protein
MKLYHFLVLSLFAFVSCEKIKTPFGDQTVYEFEETKKGTIKFSELEQMSQEKTIPYQGLNEFKGKVGEIEFDVNVSFKISDDENCVYYVYKISNFIFPKNQSKQVSEMISKLIKPQVIRMLFFDKEGNKVFSFLNDFNFDQSLYDLVLSREIKDIPILKIGKVKLTNSLKEPRPVMSAGLFRSKVERLHTHKFQFYYSAKGSLLRTF